MIVCSKCIKYNKHRSSESIIYNNAPSTTPRLRIDCVILRNFEVKCVLPILCLGGSVLRIEESRKVWPMRNIAAMLKAL